VAEREEVAADGAGGGVMALEQRPGLIDSLKAIGWKLPDDLLEAWLRDVIGLDQGERFEAGDLVADLRAARNGSAPSLEGAAPQALELDAFLLQDEEQAEPLLGTSDDTFLTTAGLLLLAGEGGSSKTTLTLDAVAHLAAGLPWLEIPVPRPVRVLLIENEGARGRFRQKLTEKVESWEGPAWRENVFVCASPWGQFSFADERHRVWLRNFCGAHEIDLVVGDPLDSLGIIGAGTPEETRAFIAWLKDCGLFSSVSFWLNHHLNKRDGSPLKQLSGAWGGHPDSVLHATLDGQHRTKLTFAKLRWATPRESLLLEWAVEQRGFSAIETNKSVSDDELAARIVEYLTATPDPKQRNSRGVQTAVTGGKDRISQLLKTDERFVNEGTATRPTWGLRENVAPEPTGHSDEELKWR
jgi:hypothetical protein